MSMKSQLSGEWVFSMSQDSMTSAPPIVATQLPGGQRERVNVSFDLFGVGQPTYDGLQQVCAYL